MAGVRSSFQTVLMLEWAPVLAGGMVKFQIPAVENAKVGDEVTLTLLNDNNLMPLQSVY